jgi:hypothetical protein
MIYPTEQDIGRRVIYVPQHAQNDTHHKDAELGVISSFNNRFVFVRYDGDAHTNSKATYRINLHWGGRV